jgi:hypothetical protein
MYKIKNKQFINIFKHFFDSFTAVYTIFFTGDRSMGLFFDIVL